MDEHLIRGFAVCQTQRTQIITFIQCWTNVEDVGFTLYKCYTNVLCLLGKVSEASEAHPYALIQNGIHRIASNWVICCLLYSLYLLYYLGRISALYIDLPVYPRKYEMLTQCLFNHFSAGNAFRRHNLTSIDVRFIVNPYNSQI